MRLTWCGIAKGFCRSLLPLCLRSRVCARRWFVRGGGLYAHALGVYGYAAVPRVGLWPNAPPLCRYAVHTKRMGSIQGGRAAVQDPLVGKAVFAMAAKHSLR
jgi:hypothetical protein